MNYRSIFSGAPAAALACCFALLACNDNDGTLVTPAGTAGISGTAGVTAAGVAGTTAAAGTSGTPTGAAGRSGLAGSGSSGRSGAAGRASAAGAGGASGNAGSAGASGSASEDDAGVTEEDDAGAPPEPEEPTPADAGAPDAQTPTEEPEDLGEGDGRDVITIGDSWMSNTLGSGDGIEGALDRLTGQPYRNYGVQGVLLLESSLFGAAIPTQYEEAKRRDPEISTVIMTGGGNDIIQNPAVEASCQTAGDACKAKLAEITAALNTLWTEMAEDGVKDVVLIRYAEDAGSTDPAVRMLAGTPAICATDEIRCHTVETTEAVMGDLLDGIHPTRAANDRIAKVVQDLLVAKGIRR